MKQAMAAYRMGVLFSILFLAGVPLLGAAQEAEGKGTVVSLGAVSGAPKRQVIVPMFLTPSSPEIEVGSVSATVVFDSKLVVFVRAEKGFLLDGVDGAIQVELQNEAREHNQSVLNMQVSTQGEPRKTLRDGLVLSLIFEITADAPPGSNIALSLEKLRAEDLDSPPKVVEPIFAKNGSIEVLSPESVPVVNCFFFTH